MELSDEARKKLEEAFIFAGRELLAKGCSAVVVDGHAAFDIAGRGGVVIRGSGLLLKKDPPAKEAGIPGDAGAVANAELLRILKTKKGGS